MSQVSKCSPPSFLSSKAEELLIGFAPALIRALKLPVTEL